ncbi:MAG: hypothetical protein A2941_02190 [Candidatus Yanofskybacteria bacterium RIFCSPLOWO2_01_FULL_49_17]|uniref:Thrombospondin type 3 repeat superfamily protein n=1 Tax=Candidatus Yanofskybacteria bacterium RIFCSPLOWO2_01_FULL_49_17 TaxID=1802700 RepID=A0A1F8GSG8_9BACT|nr:MAG: hypothetical protein A2941_02190 [Candidatus Yanofskybacteria bacterium RIFCSPLOWO2_01_FULL_49_17]
MPIKRNLVIVIVAVIAVFSVYQLSKYVHKLALSGPTLTAVSSFSNDDQNCAICDPDHDGLTNAEEVLWNTDPFNSDTDGDGFKDGEETASGHNPLVPGPDDLINSDNLTEQLANLTVAGLVAGELNPASGNYEQTLADITSSVADSAKYLFNKQVDAGLLNIIPGNSDSNNIYVRTVSHLVQRFSDAFGEQLNRLIDDLNTTGSKGFTGEMKDYYSRQAEILDALFNDALSMPVTRPFSSFHTGFAALVMQLKSIDEAMADGDKDTVKATLALQALGDVPDKYIYLLNIFTDAIQGENVEIDPL